MRKWLFWVATAVPVIVFVLVLLVVSAALTRVRAWRANRWLVRCAARFKRWYGERIPACRHTRVQSAVCDQTLAVVCTRCDTELAVCWRDAHIPESLWNRACANDPKCRPCEQSRDDVCAICKANIQTTQRRAR